MQEPLRLLHVRLQKHLLALGASYRLATSKWQEEPVLISVPWGSRAFKNILCYATEANSLEILKQELSQFVFPNAETPDYAIVLLQHSLSATEGKHFLKHFSIPALLVDAFDEKFLGSPELIPYVEPLFVSPSKADAQTIEIQPPPAALFWEEFLYGARLHLLTPQPRATWGLLLIFSFIFVLHVFSGYQPPQTAEDVLRLGALFGPNLVVLQEWWRYLSAPCVHLGWLHFLMNGLSLFYLGRFTERLYGSRAWILLTFGSGIVASSAGIFFEPFILLSGSSGMVFGCLGTLVATLVLGRKTIPKTVQKKLWKAIFWIVALNIGTAWFVGALAHSAHLAGMLAGIFGGLLLYSDNPVERSRTRNIRSILFLLSVFALCGAALYFVRNKIEQTQKIWKEPHRLLMEIHQSLSRDFLFQESAFSVEQNQQILALRESLKNVEGQLQKLSFSLELFGIAQAYYLVLKQTLGDLSFFPEKRPLLQKKYRQAYQTYESLVHSWISSLP